MATRLKQKTCSCCGGDAGKFHQFSARDTGYGVCKSCVIDEIKRGTWPADLRRMFGIPGVHYQALTTKEHQKYL